MPHTCSSVPSGDGGFPVPPHANGHHPVFAVVSVGVDEPHTAVTRRVTSDVRQSRGRRAAGHRGLGPGGSVVGLGTARSGWVRVQLGPLCRDKRRGGTHLQHPASVARQPEEREEEEEAEVMSMRARTIATPASATGPPRRRLAAPWTPGTLSDAAPPFFAQSSPVPPASPLAVCVAHAPPAAAAGTPQRPSPDVVLPVGASHRPRPRPAHSPLLPHAPPTPHMLTARNATPSAAHPRGDSHTAPVDEAAFPPLGRGHATAPGTVPARPTSTALDFAAICRRHSKPVDPPPLPLSRETSDVEVDTTHVDSSATSVCPDVASIEPVDDEPETAGQVTDPLGSPMSSSASSSAKESGLRDVSVVDENGDSAVMALAGHQTPDPPQTLPASAATSSLEGDSQDTSEDGECIGPLRLPEKVTPLSRERDELYSEEHTPPKRDRPPSTHLTDTTQPSSTGTFAPPSPISRSPEAPFASEEWKPSVVTTPGYSDPRSPYAAVPPGDGYAHHMYPAPFPPYLPYPHMYPAVTPYMMPMMPPYYPPPMFPMYCPPPPVQAESPPVRPYEEELHRTEINFPEHSRTAIVIKNLPFNMERSELLRIWVSCKLLRALRPPLTVLG